MQTSIQPDEEGAGVAKEIDGATKGPAEIAFAFDTFTVGRK
jgi:hypothetical protein